MFIYRTGWVKAKRNPVSEEGPFCTGRQQLTPLTEQRDQIPTCSMQPTLTPDGLAPSAVQLTSALAWTLRGHACLGVVCGRPGLQAPPCRWGQDGWNQN